MHINFEKKCSISKCLFTFLVGSGRSKTNERIFINLSMSFISFQARIFYQFQLLLLNTLKKLLKQSHNYDVISIKASAQVCYGYLPTHNEYSCLPAWPFRIRTKNRKSRLDLRWHGLLHKRTWIPRGRGNIVH